MNEAVGDKRIKHFRQILLWPLELAPIKGVQIQKHWQYLEQAQCDAGAHPWEEVEGRFAGGTLRFEERHYAEFVTFLPPVRRFLYGEAGTESPIRIYRRSDVAKVRMIYKADDLDPVTFDVHHIDLYFFLDIDLTILVMELGADDIALDQAQDTLYRFGRAYPAYWDDNGLGGHCLKKVEWLAADGAVLAVSDYEKQEKYISFVRRHRVPNVAAHWEFLLKPMVLDQSDQKGALRYRQLEYHRMPLMAYLACEDVDRLSRADFTRLGLVSPLGESDDLPYSGSYLANFERDYCHDRYWRPGAEGRRSRFMTCGHAFVTVGNAGDPFFVDADNGVWGQFRHQYFLSMLIAHLHKAALHMLSDRLVLALNRLEIHHPESVKRFKRSIRQIFEIFLRFTHRYWFHDISDQTQTKELFRMTVGHLGTDRLFAEVREEIEDMSQYLDSDSLRRQANTVVRLTVVTTFGLIGTVTTGFLGMNLIASADAPLLERALFFLLVLLPVTGLTVFTVIRSKRLSDFLEALSDERMGAGDKWRALSTVWQKKD